MTKDFGPALDSELDTASPPTAITADEIIHKGRKQSASRKAYTGVASVIALVLAAGMVFQIGRTATGGDVSDPNPSASTGPVQPSFPLPEVDPAAEWRWQYNVGHGTETETTKALTDAWWAALSGVDGGVPAVVDEDTAEPSAATREQFDPVLRFDDALVEDVRSDAGGYTGESVPQGYTRPIYRLETSLLFDGLPRPDHLTAQYFPRGSYLDGTEIGAGAGRDQWDWRHLYDGCEDETASGGGSVDYTCATSTGPNGERVIEIDLVVVHPDGWPPSRSSVVVVYFADGNAVLVVDDAPQGMAPEDTTPSIEDPTPGLTPHQLAEMVFAMQPVVIT